MPDHSAEYRAYKLLQKIIMGCAAAIVVAVFVLFLYASNKSQGRCEDLQSLRSYVLHSTDRAIKSLPTIAYYKEHPRERQAALENLQNQREEFATPLNCSLF
jgi:ABC-type transport system involved in cytochrome bd biosynthesis fused ATPase/permease subunit